MHGVIMIPIATPDETVLLKNGDDFLGNPILITKRIQFTSILIGPKPIIRVY